MGRWKMRYWRILNDGMGLLRGRWRILIVSMRILYRNIGGWTACCCMSSVRLLDFILRKL